MRHDPEIDPTIREAAEAAVLEKQEEERTERIVRRTLRKIQSEGGVENMPEEEPAETETPAPKRRSALRRTWDNMVSGSFLGSDDIRRSYPFMVFVAVLIILYIANVFNTQSLYRRHNTLAREIKALRTESLSLASERMKATRQSNIVAEINRRGIPVKESPVPVKVIEKR